MTTRQALEEYTAKINEIATAKRTLKMGGLGSAGSDMIIAEMAIQKLACQTIGQCEAYLHLASIMLQILQAEVLDTEMTSENEKLFREMKGARDHLQEIIKGE